MFENLEEVHVSEAACMSGVDAVPYISLHLSNIECTIEDIGTLSKVVGYGLEVDDDDAYWTWLGMLCTERLEEVDGEAEAVGLSFMIYERVATHEAHSFHRIVSSLDQWRLYVRLNHESRVVYLSVTPTGEVVAHQIVPIENVAFAFPDTWHSRTALN